MDFLYPIPLPELKKRFSPIFTQFQKTRHATVVALPFSGRSSHLRFINSQPNLQIELGKPVSDQFVWVETKSAKNFVQLATQICIVLDPTLISNPILVSQDEYLVATLLQSTISKISHPIILCLTLGRANIEIHPEIEHQFILLIKQCPNLKILWSLDSFSLRNYKPGHTSTPIVESVYYLPSFSKPETDHSLKRTAKNRDKSLSKKVLANSMELTGGLAGLFHLLVFQGESYLHTPQVQEILKTVSTELTLSPDLSIHLSTPELRNFINSSQAQTHSHGPIQLKSAPTAQDITILDLLLKETGQLVTRDQVAESIWGKQVSKKYSDWAIDKAISRLKTKLNSKTYILLTVKNLGYKLLCQTN